jgi:phosphoglycolate phosphatase-like HAD superfamily hydrolase
MLTGSESSLVKSLRSYLAENPKKCLVFDFDETIFTLELPWETYFAELRRRLYKLDESLAEIDGIAQFENEAVRRLGAKARAIRDEYSAFFEREYLSEVIEHQDLTDFIRNERENYTYFLWSSNMSSTIEPELARTKLLPLFAQLICKDSVSLIKPDPEGFAQIFDETNFQRKEYLMIGNSHHDKAAAEAAGIDFFLVEH